MTLPQVSPSQGVSRPAKRSMVEVRVSDFGGFGLFATECFEEDDEIIAEFPFISLVDITEAEGNPHNHWTTTPLTVSDSCEAAQRIEKAVNELSAENQHLFWDFSQAEIYGTKRTAHGIFYTNYIDVTQEHGADIGCMFRHISRVNHSCKPNVYWCYLQTEGKLVLHASRKVAPGEELFVDYCGHDECDDWWSPDLLSVDLPQLSLFLIYLKHLSSPLNRRSPLVN